MSGRAERSRGGVFRRSPGGVRGGIQRLFLQTERYQIIINFSDLIPTRYDHPSAPSTLQTVVPTTQEAAPARLVYAEGGGKQGIITQEATDITVSLLLSSYAHRQNLILPPDTCRSSIDTVALPYAAGGGAIYHTYLNYYSISSGNYDDNFLLTGVGRYLEDSDFATQTIWSGGDFYQYLLCQANLIECLQTADQDLRFFCGVGDEIPVSGDNVLYAWRDDKLYAIELKVNFDADISTWIAGKFDYKSTGTVFYDYTGGLTDWTYDKDHYYDRTYKYYNCDVQPTDMIIYRAPTTFYGTP